MSFVWLLLSLFLFLLQGTRNSQMAKQCCNTKNLTIILPNSLKLKFTYHRISICVYSDTLLWCISGMVINWIATGRRTRMNKSVNYFNNNDSLISSKQSNSSSNLRVWLFQRSSVFYFWTRRVHFQHFLPAAINHTICTSAITSGLGQDVRVPRKLHCH